jgi:hypothetical protein
MLEGSKRLERVSLPQGANLGWKKHGTGEQGIFSVLNGECSWEMALLGYWP